MLGKRDRCYICGRRDELELHHIYFGNPWRKISDENGFTVMLCPGCHRTKTSAVHRSKDTDLRLKQIMQHEFEKQRSREDFIKLIGRNYL